MAQPWQPSPEHLFKGSDWEECEAFIHRIRCAGWREGQFMDARWLAQFAGLHFIGSALSWHIRLPLDVQRDWNLLEAALVERWSPPGEDIGNPNPAPAALPRPITEELTDRSICGILKFVADQPNTAVCYVSEVIGSDGACNLSRDVDRALRLRFGPQSRLYIMELMEGARYSWLSVHWRNSKPNIGSGCKEAAKLSVVDSETLAPSFKGKGPFRFAVWEIMHDGDVRLSWRKSNTDERVPLSTFIDGYPDLYVTADANSYAREFPHEKKGRLIFERLA